MELIGTIKTIMSDLKSNVIREFSYIWKKNPVGAVGLIGYAVLLFIAVHYIFDFIYVFITFDSRIFPSSTIGQIMMILFAAGMFPLVTFYDKLSENTKKAMLLLSYIDICLILLSILFTYSGIWLFPKIFAIRVTDFFTGNMILALARIVELYICGIPAYGMGLLVVYVSKNEQLMKELMFFRLSQYVDMRENRKYAYDITLGRNIVDGIPCRLYENDRYLHQADDGVSGTGKTSLVFANGIEQDLRTRQKNERIQKAFVRKMLKSHTGYRQVERDTFFIDDYVAYPAFPEVCEELAYLKSVCRVAGQTIIAPNSSILDKTYDLCKAYGTPVYRIDPAILPNGCFKEGFSGYNPFYINPELFAKQDIFYVRAVSRAVDIYRDVIEALYITSGSSDPYFLGVNSSTNRAVSLLCVLTYPYLYGRQANPVDALNEMVGFKPVEEQEMYEVEKDGRTMTRKKTVLRSNPRLIKLMEVYDNQCPSIVHKAFDDNLNIFVRTEILGDPNRAKALYEQSQGLRDQVNAFVNNPFIRPIFTMPDDKCVSISHALEHGEIILFNFYQEMGDLSRIFGLFFLLNFNATVFARGGNEDTRVPHFLRIDELPTILHKVVGDMISEYRQFRVVGEFAFQSLTQMDETALTKYLAGILMSCGTQLIFGRTNLVEMERYSKLAGKKYENKEQRSYNSDSKWSEKDIVEGIRNIPTEVNVLEESDLRRRNFRECTVFTVRNGVPVNPIFSRFEFLPNTAYESHVTKEDGFNPSDYPVYPKEEISDIQPMETFVVESGHSDRIRLVPDASGKAENHTSETEEDDIHLTPAGFQPEEPEYEPDYGRFDDEPEEERKEIADEDVICDAFNIHMER